MEITTTDALRDLYPQPRERALKKQLAAIDVHARRFIELSPFVVLASGSATSALDASPRGGAPGFVKVADAHTLLIPDSPGNNRLDSCRNIVETGGVGLLFMIPGFDETLRVNGSATLTTDAALLARCADERRTPRLVIRVAVREVYLHCAKAFMRSRLWEPDARLPRETLPTMGQMINDQTGIQTPPETREQMCQRYAADL
ncbi:MAG TPA: pyridoxamine 5'-phosphate oxidase family protein [Burkholderiaceae bacterium]|nr:pyridoxamine 5'-phosphate oxidase family protein [Burkholderiaceae bacterium]